MRSLPAPAAVSGHDDAMGGCKLPIEGCQKIGHNSSRRTSRMRESNFTVLCNHFRRPLGDFILSICKAMFRRAERGQSYRRPPGPVAA